MSESVKNNKSERDLVPILQDKVIELQVSYEKARIEKEDLKSITFDIILYSVI